ncbi:hypothetical protein C8J57DRAFT_1499199 [Mycena rebaudengoi]|nr:hypothetical protein C8J57DRAFT_1499199 [Mycena rebaudengoi]
MSCGFSWLWNEASRRISDVFGAMKENSFILPLNVYFEFFPQPPIRALDARDALLWHLCPLTCDRTLPASHLRLAAIRLAIPPVTRSASCALPTKAHLVEARVLVACSTMTGVHLVRWPPLSHALLYRSQQMHKRRLPAEDDKLAARGPGFQPRPMQANKTASHKTNSLTSYANPTLPRGASAPPVSLADSVMQQPSTRALLTSKCTASCDFPSQHIRTLDAAPMLQDTPSH